MRRLTQHASCAQTRTLGLPARQTVTERACAGICQAEDIRERIERLRRHLYEIYERSADEREILAVSRELDRLIIELLRLDHDACRSSDAPDAS